MVLSRVQVLMQLSMFFCSAIVGTAFAQQNPASIRNPIILANQCPGIMALMVSLNAVCKNESRYAELAQTALEELPNNATSEMRNAALQAATTAAENLIQCTTTATTHCTSVTNAGRRLRRRQFCSILTDRLLDSDMICQSESAALSAALTSGQNLPNSSDKEELIYQARWDLTDCLNRTLENCF